ncbi:permease [Oxalobacteraceae bacterium A2-2]
MQPFDAPRRALSFDANPSLSLPLRYFLSAPLFAALAFAFLAWHGEAALLTRWSPLTLAVVHLMVLGCLSMAMTGALLQILPVAAGLAVPRVALVGKATHIGLCLGSLLLAAAFWQGSPLLFQLALAPLLAALLLFLGACTVGMWRRHLDGSGPMMAGVRLALAALLVTVTLGGLLARAFGWPGAGALPLQRLTDLHAMWGLLGWVGLLVIAVAFQVVPMFMLTQSYPRWMTGSYSTTLFLLLVAASLSSGLTGPGLWFHQASLVLLAAGHALFGATTLHLLARRARPKADPTTLYWRTAMASLLAALALWLCTEGHEAAPLALGVLLIAGFALSAINGMLYKIVPFLVWYHLHERIPPNAVKLPGVNKIIPERYARWQFGAHLAALLLLLGACLRPAWLARPAAALMCAACLGMAYNLCAAARLYWRLHRTPHPVLSVTTSS